MIQIDNCNRYFRNLILQELHSYSTPIQCWVAGGALKSYFLGENPTDIDLFFPDNNEFQRGILHFRDYEEMKGGKEAKIIFENDNVIKYKYKGKIFDLVKKHFKDPQETINQFDFTVTCAATDGDKFYQHPSFFIDLAKKQLMVNNLPYPLSTMWRMQKYMLKGYRMCKEEMLKVAQALQDPKNIIFNTDSESNVNFGDSGNNDFNGID